MNCQDLFSILIVDDESALAEALQQFFSSKGWRATTASSADEALQVLKNEVFDFVLSDISMPKVSGLGLATAIREMRTSRALIYLMTAHAEIPEAVYRPLGVQSLFTKPFDMQMVLEVFTKEKTGQKN